MTASDFLNGGFELALYLFLSACQEDLFHLTYPNPTLLEMDFLTSRPISQHVGRTFHLTRPNVG